MEVGPKTIRPSEPLEELLRSRESVGVKHFLVASSHGEFMGVLDREHAERAVKACGAREHRGSRPMQRFRSSWWC
jgi:hypothetical protein